MEISFSKYHGTGNDFIIIDKTNQPEIELSEKEIRFLCDRRFGIGADGLMIYYPA
jgi:diaminopimelate epimerase